MTNSSDEQVSALIDGELDEHECHSAVDKLLTQGDMRKAWGRYHLIRDTLNHGLPNGVDHDFSSRVMAALENEPTVLAPPTRVGSSWRRHVAGLAVAASVAAVAVMGVQFMYQQDGQAPAQQVAKVPANLSPLSAQNLARANIQPSIQPNLLPNIQTVTQSSGVINSGYVNNGGSQIINQYHPSLNKYLVDHNQLASRAAVQSVIPYARIAAYPNSRHILIQAKK